MSFLKTYICEKFIIIIVNNKVNYVIAIIIKKKNSIINFLQKIIKLFCHKTSLFENFNLIYFALLFFYQKLSILLDFGIVNSISK